MMGDNSERIKQIRSHIRALRHDNWLTEIRTIDNGRIGQAFFTDVEHAVTHVSAVSGSANVFVGINPRFAPYGDAAHVAAVGTIVFDFDPVEKQGRLTQSDFTDLEGLLAARAIPAQPIYSGRGVHFYTFFEPIPIMGNTEPLNNFNAGLKILAADIRRELPVTIKLDNIFDPARVIRVAGTINMMNGELTHGQLDRKESAIPAQIIALRGENLQHNKESTATLFNGSQSAAGSNLDKRILQLVEGGPDSDASLVDWKICLAALRAGYNDAEITQILWDRPNSKARRHANPNHYITITIKNAKRKLGLIP